MRVRVSLSFSLLTAFLSIPWTFCAFAALHAEFIKLCVTATATVCACALLV